MASPTSLGMILVQRILKYIGGKYEICMISEEIVSQLNIGSNCIDCKNILGDDNCTGSIRWKCLCESTSIMS